MDDVVDTGEEVDFECDVGDSAQIVEKVKVKRNRGLRRDIKVLLVENPVITPSQVFDMVKNNSYGGDKPVSLNTVMSTMYQLKPKVL